MFENKYPYTDFSQLNLDWFLLKFKELLAEQERVSGKVQSLDETVQQFTDFVTGYFDDLDVQEEINTKLNEMAEAGTLSALIAPYIPGNVATSVTSWLNENVDPVGSAVTIDKTLTISNSAADSKTVGDKFDEIVTPDIKYLTQTSDDVSAESTHGFVDSVTGDFTANAAYTAYKFKVPADGYIWFDSNTFIFNIAVYPTTEFVGMTAIGVKSLGTVPTVNNKFTVAEDNVVVISILNDKTFLMYYSDHNVLNDTQLKYIDDKLSVKEIRDFILTENDDFPVEHKIYYDNGTSGTNNTVDATGLIPVNVGDKVYVSGVMAGAFHLLLAYSSMITVSGAYFQSGVDLEYVVPDGVHYVRCQGRNSTHPEYYIPFDVRVVSNNLAYLNESKIRIAKNDSTHFSISVPDETGTHKVIHEYEHITKTWNALAYEDGNGQIQTAVNVKSCDYWNCYHDYGAETGDEIAQGHSNFILKVYGDVSHCGNGHGNEVIQSFYLLADGKVVDLDNMENGTTVVCAAARVIERCVIYKVGGDTGGNDYTSNYPALDTNGNPIVRFIHTMDISYQIGNKITMDNSLLVKDNNIRFSQCHGAMLQCYFNAFNKVKINNSENTINTVAGQNSFTPDLGCNINLSVDKSQKGNIVEMWGDEFCVREEMIQNNPTRFDKSRVYFYTYNDRLKCYFQPVIAEFGLLPGETMETFNTGDVISVTTKRTIEV